MEMAIIASIHQILVCELCWTDSRSSTYWIFPSVIYLKPFHFRASLIFIWFEFLFFCIFFTLCDFPDGNDATEAKKKSNGSLWRRIWQLRAARKYRSIFIFYRAQLLKSIFFWTEWGGIYNNNNKLQIENKEELGEISQPEGRWSWSMSSSSHRRRNI
jgi:hypothetical protein